jgi:tRNA pseudouridine synthase 10
VRGLHWTGKERVRVIKEEPHAKEYEARVESEGPIERARAQEFLGKRLAVVQQTPQRVAHRRADKARERWIEFVSIEPIAGSPDYRVRMRTEHGTYVKEAIHGEGGQTRPSLSELVGVPCRCTELDVTAILDVEGKEEEKRPEARGFGSGVA